MGYWKNTAMALLYLQLLLLLSNIYTTEEIK